MLMKKKYLKGGSITPAGSLVSQMIPFINDFIYRVIFGNEECTKYLEAVRKEIGDSAFKLLLIGIPCDIFFPKEFRKIFHEKMKDNDYDKLLNPVVEKLVDILGLDNTTFVPLDMPLDHDSPTDSCV